MAQVKDILANDEAGEVTCLDYLLAREEAAVVGKVRILGADYDLRNANVVEDFLVIVGSAEKLDALMASTKEGEAPDPDATLALQKKIVQDLWALSRALCPDLPQELLTAHFGTVAQGLRLFQELQALVLKAASPALKKNSGNSKGAPKPEAETAEE